MYLKLLIISLKSIIHIIQLQLSVNFQNFFAHYTQKHFALVLTSNILKIRNVLISIMNYQLNHVKIILNIYNLKKIILIVNVNKKVRNI